MKIMTAMYTLKRGGSYDRFVMMLEAFLERKCHVHCLSLTPILISHPLYHNHVVALPLKIGNGFITKAVILFLFPFYLLLMGWREKIDLIVAFGPLYAFLQTLSRWILKKPMVTFFRLEPSLRTGIRNPWKPSFFLNAMIEYVGMAFSDRIIANNMATKEKIIAGVRDRKKGYVSVLFNDIPSMPPSRPEMFLHMRTRLGVPAQGKLVVTAGVVTRRKNFEVLLRCIPFIEMNNLFLAIIGDVSGTADSLYFEYLKRLRRELNLEKRVVFTGWVEKEELWRIFGVADLFVLPSLKEGMPNVLLEALGVDLPCVGSNIPGIRDILHFEELMFDPADKRAVGTKILQALSDARLKTLCMERKKIFLFDWKEKVFQVITEAVRTWESSQKNTGVRLRESN